MIITEAAEHDVGIPQVPAVFRVQQRTYVQNWTNVQQRVNTALNEVPSVDGDRAYFKAANDRIVRSEMTPLLWGENVCALQSFCSVTITYCYVSCRPEDLF